MKPNYKDRKPRAKQDFADKAARKALKDFRRGSQIDGGCIEVYAAVAAAIRHAANAAYNDDLDKAIDAAMSIGFDR